MSNRFENLTDSEVEILAANDNSDATKEMHRRMIAIPMAKLWELVSQGDAAACKRVLTRATLVDVINKFNELEKETAGFGFNGCLGVGTVAYLGNGGYIVQDVTDEGITYEFNPAGDCFFKTFNLKGI